MKRKRFAAGLICIFLVLPFIIGVTPSLQWGDTPLKTNLPPVIITGESTYKIVETRRIPVPSPFLPGGKERPVIIVTTAGETIPPKENKAQPTPQTPGCAYRNSITAQVATFFKGAEAYEKRGKYLFLNRRYAEAIESFFKLIQSYPESPLVGDAYFWIGECYFQMGEIPRAEQNYKVTAMRFPSSSYADYATYSLGWIAFKKKAFAEAVRYFKNGVSAYPNSPIYAHLLFWLAESYMQQKEKDSAAEYFRKVLKSTSDPRLKTPATFEIAKIAFLRKDYRTCRKTLDFLLHQNPPSSLVPKIYLLRGWSEYFMKDSQALSTFSQALRFPHIARTLKEEAEYGKALSAIQQRKPEIARAMLSTMGFDSPWYGEVAVELASYFFDQKAYKLAEKICGKIFQNFAKTPYLENAYMILGNCAYNTRDYANATEYYTHVILGKVDRLKPMAIFAKGLAFYQMGQFRDAIDSWEALLKRYPTFPRRRDTLYWLGSAYLNIHQEKAATAYFNQLQRYPNNYSKALMQLAEYWFSQQKWGHTLQALKHFLTFFPHSRYTGFAKGMMGEVYFNLKDYRQASRWLLLAIQDKEVVKNPEYRAKITFLMGKVDYMQGAFRQAIGYFSIVATRLPRNAFSDDAQYWEALSYYSEQAYKPAIQSFQRVLTVFPHSPLRAKALMKIGDCYYNLKAYRKSEAYYRKAAILYGKDKKIRENAVYGMILSLYQRKDYKGFFTEATAFMQRYPGSPLTLDVLQLLSEYYERQGNIDREIALLDKYLKAHKSIPHADAIRLNLARLFIKKGLYDSALVQLKQVSGTHLHSPFKSIAEKEMGDLYFKQKLYDQAALHYRNYLEMEKLPPETVQYVKQQLALAYLYVNRLKSARREIEMGTRAFGLTWGAPLYLKIGATYLDKKMYKSALWAFRTAAKSSAPGIKCQSLTSMAIIYRKTGKYDKSLKTLLMVRYSYPECREASEKALLDLALALKKKGRRDEARQLLTVLAKSHQKKIKRLAQKALNRLH